MTPMPTSAETAITIDEYYDMLSAANGYIFAYGSLMWRPDFTPQASLKLLLEGWHRSLCIYSIAYRGTKQYPGLVFGLNEGGICQGLALQLPGETNGNSWRNLAKMIWDREMIHGTYKPILTSGKASDAKIVNCVTFVVNKNHSQFAEDLPLAQLCERINNAVGPSGSNLDYVLNSYKQLKSLAINDPYLTKVVTALCNKTV